MTVHGGADEVRDDEGSAVQNRSDTQGSGSRRRDCPDRKRSANPRALAAAYSTWCWNIWWSFASTRILEEYGEVARRPELGINTPYTDLVLDFLESNSLRAVAPPLPVALPDADDLPFLEVASDEGVPLVTGNTRHYPKRARCGVEVLSPREFLETLRGRT